MKFTMILADIEAMRIIEALVSTKGDVPATGSDRALANRIQRALDYERNHAIAVEAAKKAEDKRREERAKNHVLTKRQAEVIAAIRAGRSASDVPYYWTDEQGVRQWRFKYTRSMGGATSRMVDSMVEEGLLVHSRAATPAAFDRLIHYEAKHGSIAPLEELKR